MLLPMPDLAIDFNAYPESEPLVNQARTMIETGKTVRIDTRYVPFKVRSKTHKTEFRTYQTRLFDLYKSPVYGFAQCLHEAAHAILMEEDGIPKTVFGGPGIRYDRQTKTLFAYAAKIDPIGEPPQTVDEALIFKRALHATVGAVALEKYAGITEKSDDQDYKDFAKKYATMPPELRREDPLILWGRAQQKAKTRLDSSDTKEKIFARVPDFLHLLYL